MFIKEKYKKVINELTKLHEEGIQLKELRRLEYEFSFSNNLYVIIHSISNRNEFKKWKDKVAKSLIQYLPNSRYISHFNNPEIKNEPIFNIRSEMMKNYLNIFKAHIFALQNIIWNFTQEDLESEDVKIQLSDSAMVNDLIFIKKSSKRKKVYLILKNSTGYVSSKELCKKSNVKSDDLRSIIAQLRKNIINQNLKQILKIDHVVNQGYKLIYLDLKKVQNSR